MIYCTNRSLDDKCNDVTLSMNRDNKLYTYNDDAKETRIPWRSWSIIHTTNLLEPLLLTSSVHRDVSIAGEREIIKCQAVPIAALGNVCFSFNTN